MNVMTAPGVLRTYPQRQIALGHSRCPQVGFRKSGLESAA